MTQKRLTDIFHPEVIAARPEDAIQDAIQLMRDRNVSCVVVLDQGELVGIFTERDLVRCVAEFCGDFWDRPIAEVMTRGVHTVQVDAFLYEAFHLLATNGIRHLAVLDESGKPVGMVTQSDLIHHLGYDYFIKVKTVSQIMQGCMVTILPEATVQEASREMASRAMSFLVVATTEGRPEGVITERDVSRLAAEGRDMADISVRQVMSSPVVTVRSNAQAYLAAETMRQRGIRRLVVVDELGTAVGVTTQTDLVHGLESKYVETLKQIIVGQGRELDRTIRELSKKTLYLETILSSLVDMGIVATDAEGRIIYFNAGAERLLRRSAVEMVGRELDEIHAGEGVPPERLVVMKEAVQQGRTYSFAFARRSGARPLYLQARLSGIRAKDGLTGFVLLLLDTTEQYQAEETIRRLAFYDTLTDLPNRTLFNQRLSQELARARRNHDQLALMMLDMDRFKEINDTLGHAVGDQVLHEVAQRLKSGLRESDIVARMGGDEFALVALSVTGREAAVAVARKVLDAFDAPLRVDGQDLRVCMSVGVAMFPEHGLDMETLLRQADAAMYRAKEQGHGTGRSSVCVSE
ncbi:MAG: hypothetical protein BWK76_08415 [Desulfobulbaceae bacterium A2]|nr:MAG: hypothetical protein BWK76_08415 [Desulfobulbaceae bacterium A2]